MKKRGKQADVRDRINARRERKNRLRNREYVQRPTWEVSGIKYHHKIYLKGDLELLRNPEQTIAAFESITDLSGVPAHIRTDRDFRVFLDFTEVTRLDPPAFLWITALIDNLPHRVCGNLPDQDQPRDLMNDLGFLNHMTSLFKPPPKKSGDVLTLQRHRKKDGKADMVVANQLAEFLNVSKLPADGGMSNFDALANAFSECSENAVVHGYPVDGLGRWYAMGARTKTSRQAIIADLGVGIPATLKKKSSDKIRQFFGWLGPLPSNEEQLIKLAVRGKRTASGKYFHGNGLSELAEAAEVLDGTLSVYSNRARIHISTTEESTFPIKHPMKGTLVCFELRT